MGLCTKKCPYLQFLQSIYLYKIVIILQSHDVIYKRKWIDSVGRITISATICRLNTLGPIMLKTKIRDLAIHGNNLFQSKRNYG